MKGWIKRLNKRAVIVESVVIFVAITGIIGVKIFGYGILGFIFGTAVSALIVVLLVLIIMWVVYILNWINEDQKK